MQGSHFSFLKKINPIFRPMCLRKAWDILSILQTCRVRKNVIWTRFFIGFSADGRRAYLQQVFTSLYSSMSCTSITIVQKKYNALLRAQHFFPPDAPPDCCCWVTCALSDKCDMVRAAAHLSPAEIFSAVKIVVTGTIIIRSTNRDPIETCNWYVRL